MADPRRPIVASRAITDELAVICDDGAVFQYVGRRWKEVAPVPGSPRAGEVEWKHDPKLLPAKR